MSRCAYRASRGACALCRGFSLNLHKANWPRQSFSTASSAFFAEHAKARRYFYTVDLLGRLFSAETRARNLATCVKDNKALDFFFKQLRPNATGLLEREYPWISPCGAELNFVAADDTPIVFTGLVDSQLTYGGTLRQPFVPAHLRLSASSGRLYHVLTGHRRMTAAPGEEPALMLLRSQIVGELEHRMSPASAREEFASLPGPVATADAASERNSGLVFEWNGKRHPILTVA